MSVDLVLASTSPYRAAALRRLGVEFRVAAPRFDERAHDPEFLQRTDEDFALLLAEGKARSLAEEYPDGWILGADQLAVLPGASRRLLHKPGTQEGAVAQLLQLAGLTHRLVTAVVCLQPRTGRVLRAVDVHELHMTTLTPQQAADYVARDLPLDCAGAYRIEAGGVGLFEWIRGADFTAIEGLPLLTVASWLRTLRQSA